MQFEVHCPRCLGVFETASSRKDREFDCPRCPCKIFVPADPGAEPPSEGLWGRLKALGKPAPETILTPVQESGTGWGPPKAADWRRPERQTDVPWIWIAVQLVVVALVAAGTAYYAAGGFDGPAGGRYAAIDDQLAGIAEVLGRIETEADLDDELVELESHVGAAKELITAPDLDGTEVWIGPEVWTSYRAELKTRLADLRDEKSRVIRIPGAGQAVASAFRELPLDETKFRAHLMLGRPPKTK
ncbi:MAG: hypothetical protein AAF907_10260 [Planctomycetota bacterium]